MGAQTTKGGSLTGPESGEGVLAFELTDDVGGDREDGRGEGRYHGGGARLGRD